MNEEAEVLRGSCLCGAVSFELHSPFLRFAYCHCSRCRKATGTGHAANLYCAPERFAWLAGQDGCVTHWEPLQATSDGRHGVNLANFDPELIASVGVRRFDGANTWTFIDP